MYSSFFFPLLFLFLSTNIFLFASQFYGNSFVDFGTCCYTYNPSIVAVAKSSIAAVLFSPISKRFICLFFLLPYKAASHTGDFYRTFFQESLSRAACLPASLELSRDFYRENFGVVKSIYSTLSSFFFTFCFIIGWFLTTFFLPLSFPPSSRSVNTFSAISSVIFKAIPHNSKCRYGERGAAAAGAVLKPQGGNCAVLPLFFRVNNLF